MSTTLELCGPLASEFARLAALESYEILDTPLEEIFQEFARLAATIVGAPTALVSFVDGNRQWFKARVGLDVGCTSRDVAFCARAIESRDLLVVTDATRDERFADNPLVTGELGIRFYAGAPLITLDGFALGTLCVIDYVPRELTPEQHEALCSLRDCVMAQLELRRRLSQFKRGSEACQQSVRALQRALERREFILHYQPIVELASGRVSKLEALIRWNCPRRGLVMPGAFVPILEESGLIVETGRWVLEQVLRDCRAWQAENIPVPRIAVNVSPLQLQHPDFLPGLRTIISSGIHPALKLEIEVTEGSMLHNSELIRDRLTRVRQLGVKVALDDFGTGYSSLQYLAHLPFDVLKIDRSFIAAMARTPEDMWLVSSVITLVHGLHREVVAEGIESGEQQQLLRRLHCDHVQGYLLSRPIPAADIGRLLCEHPCWD